MSHIVLAPAGGRAQLTIREPVVARSLDPGLTKADGDVN
jgi:hypothetical protein